MAKAKKTEVITETTIPVIPDAPAVQEEPTAIVEEEKEVELPKEPEASKEVVQVKKEPVALKPEANPALSFDDRIKAFLTAKKNGDYIKLNDFLKSLYPLPIGGQQPEWKTQGASKFLKYTLDQMIAAGEIEVNNNQHKRLGTLYYKGDNPVTQYYNLGDLPIEAKIFG